MAEWIQALNDASIPFLVWVQGFRSPSLDSFMALMSWLGTEYFFILFFPLLYWSLSKRLGLLAGLGLVFSVYIGEYIKWALQLPRPPSPPVERLWEETSPGFVSTHAAPAIGVWGMVALMARKTWIVAVALFLIVFVSFSRIYLGVHYPADVIGGWLVGLFALWAVLRLLPRFTPRLAAWPARRQILATLLLALVLLAIFPADWEGRRPAPSGVLNTGILLGFLLALIWDHHRLRFEVSGAWLQRLLRYLVGLILVLVAFVGLDILFEPFSHGDYLVAQAFRLLRYAAVGFVVPGLGPWVFQKLRLA